MTTTRGDIERWLEEAKEKSATHLIVACDTFDYDDYPVFVMPSESCQERVTEIDGRNMQRVMEVYDLSADLAYQLSERRAFHVTS